MPRANPALMYLVEQYRYKLPHGAHSNFCKTCGHLAVEHASMAGGCWHHYGETQLCLCKEFKPIPGAKRPKH